MGAADRQDISVDVVRVFTRDGGGGNHLGIHHGLLDDDTMQRAAAVLGYAETIFVARRDEVAGTDPEYDVRIFTPGAELAFAGHPLVGAAWHVADRDRTVVLHCGIGPVPGTRVGWHEARITTPVVPVARPVDAPPGVEQAWIVRMPLPYEVRRLTDPEAVATYRPLEPPANRLVFARGEDGRPDRVRARFFASGLGVEEDAATGSAAVALAAVRRADGEPTGSLVIHQGTEMGYPSRIELSWTPEDTTIGGAVVEGARRRITV
ncbi:PhzF family phenazine biosynthesis protein [soil metagenome]